MRRPDLLTRTRHGLLLLALLCILLARTSVPAGWMPIASSDGGIVLAPCSGMGVATMPAAHAMPGMVMTGDMPGMSVHATHAGEKTERHPDPTGDHPCSGAGVSVAIAMPILGVATARAIPPVAMPPARLAATIGRGLAAPPPPSTGPPFLA